VLSTFDRCDFLDLGLNFTRTKATIDDPTPPPLAGRRPFLTGNCVHVFTSGRRARTMDFHAVRRRLCA
jgi:hypothetical protein